jgi:ribosomal protein S27AE
MMNPLEISCLIKVLIRARDKMVARDYDEAQDAIEYALSCLFVERRRLQNLESSFTCPKCGAVSYNPSDIAHFYCGRCHQFYA